MYLLILFHELGLLSGAAKFTQRRTTIQVFMAKNSAENSKHIKHGKMIKSSI